MHFDACHQFACLHIMLLVMIFRRIALRFSTTTKSRCNLHWNTVLELHFLWAFNSDHSILARQRRHQTLQIGWILRLDEWHTRHRHLEWPDSYEAALIKHYNKQHKKTNSNPLHIISFNRIVQVFPCNIPSKDFSFDANLLILLFMQLLLKATLFFTFAFIFVWTN